MNISILCPLLLLQLIASAEKKGFSWWGMMDGRVKMKHEGNKLKPFGKMFHIPRKEKSTTTEIIDYFAQNNPPNHSPSPHSTSHVTFRSLSDTLVPEVNKLVFKRKCGSYSGSLGEPLLPLSKLEPKLVDETRKSRFYVLTIALCSTGFLLGLLVAVLLLKLRSRAEIV